MVFSWPSGSDRRLRGPLGDRRRNNACWSARSDCRIPFNKWRKIVACRLGQVRGDRYGLLLARGDQLRLLFDGIPVVNRASLALGHRRQLSLLLRGWVHRFFFPAGHRGGRGHGGAPFERCDLLGKHDSLGGRLQVDSHADGYPLVDHVTVFLLREGDAIPATPRQGAGQSRIMR